MREGERFVFFMIGLTLVIVLFEFAFAMANYRHEQREQWATIETILRDVRPSPTTTTQTSQLLSSM